MSCSPYLHRLIIFVWYSKEHRVQCRERKMPSSSSSNKLPFSSSFRPYSLFLVILFVVLLAVILVIVCTLGDASSFQWTRRHGSLLGYASTTLTFSGTSQVFAVADPPPTSSLNPQIVSSFIYICVCVDDNHGSL